jgi:hypothetical protein
MIRSSSARNFVWAMTTISILLTPGFAIAGGKGGGAKQAGTTKPTENTSLNYGKIEATYTRKNKGGPAKRTNVKNSNDRY